MKIKKTIMALVVILLLLTSTGCTKYVQGKDNKVVTYEKTGQNLTSNILCKPTDEDLLELYKKHEKELSVKLDKLPECDSFKLNSLKYVSLWETIFVKPLAWLILKVGDLVNNYGISVMLVGLLIRIVLLPLSIKNAKQSENMKKAQPEIQKIEKKYKDKTDSQSQMAKSQETMMVYNKYKMNPVTGCIMAFIQLPIFFAFLEAINRVPAIFEDSFLTMNLGMTPWVGIGNGQWLPYIILIALIILTTFFSFKNSMGAAGGGEAAKQMQFMSKFMIVIISIASLRLPTAIALYWVVTNGFAVVQNIIVKRSVGKDEKDGTVIKTRKK